MTEELPWSGADIIKVGIGPVVYVQQDYKQVLVSQLPGVIECADASIPWTCYC